MKNIYRLIFIICLFQSSISLAQGWEYAFSGTTVSIAQDVVQTIDSGYVAVSNQDKGSAFLIKTDQHGQEQWRKYISDTTSDFRYLDRLQVSADGQISLASLLTYTTVSNGTSQSASRINWRQFDLQGNELNRQVYNFQIEDEVQDLDFASNGNVVFAGKSSNTHSHIDSVFVGQVQFPAAQLQWLRMVTRNVYHEISVVADGNGAMVLADGWNETFMAEVGSTGLVLADHWWHSTVSAFVGAEKVIPTLDNGALLLYNQQVKKIDHTGTLVWYFDLPTIPNVSYTQDAVPLDQGGYLIVLADQVCLLDDNGSLVLTQQLQGNVSGISLQKTYDGGFILAGTNLVDVANQGGFRTHLIKGDALLQTHTNIIKGNVYKDLDYSCSLDSSDLPFGSPQLLKISNSNTGVISYETTDTTGNYFFKASLGTYTIDVVSPSVYWQSCQNQQTVVFSQPFDTTNLDFALQPTVLCPILNVDLSTVFLRRCFDNTYTIQYCNEGTAAAQNAYVELTLDPYMVYQNSSIPYSQQNGQVYRFDLGTIDTDTCGSFWITVLLDCDSTFLGQNHCVEAHIYPDSICIPTLWNGPIAEVQGICNGDSIHFFINNLGADMTTSLEYIVIEDDIILRQDDYVLRGGEQYTLKQAAREGSSYRIIVEQALGYPRILGDPSSSIVIDGCVPNPDGSFNTIFLSQFNNDNSSPFVANDCQSSIGAYDPNDKRGFPLGYDDEHYIFDNTAINYHIRFQNTGTDTAFTVKIIDTLSTYLDPTSIQVGASSHPYTWELDQQGIISFTFNNIMLPDSNINEPASHGFVKFKINQQLGNIDDTRIENSAAIYFDFNEPVITNTTWHTIGSDFILIADQLPDVARNQIQVKIAPNPIQDRATIHLDGLEGQRVDFQLLDATGRVVWELREQKDQFQLDRKRLSSGMYFYAIRHKGKLVSSGKLILLN